MLEPDTTNKAIAYDKKEKLGYAPLFINKIGESNVENIERIRSYIFKTPNDVSLWIDLASEYGNVGEYKKSIETLEKSLNIATDPQTTSVIYYNIASNYVHLGLYDEALPYAQKALRDNDDYETRGLIALIKSDQKNYKEAEEEYKILLSEKPGDIDLTLNFVDMYLSKNAFLQARKVLKKLIENNPRAKNDPRLTPYRFLIIV